MSCSYTQKEGARAGCLCLSIAAAVRARIAVVDLRVAFFDPVENEMNHTVGVLGLVGIRLYRRDDVVGLGEAQADVLDVFRITVQHPKRVDIIGLFGHGAVFLNSHDRIDGGGGNGKLNSSGNGESKSLGDGKQN